MKETPFHAVGLEYGARMTELFGYLLPTEYASGHAKEHVGTRTGVSLCDLDYMGEFVVEGPDALAFVQQISTNDYDGKPVGSIRYTAMCDDAGNMIDDGTVWRTGEREFMVVSGDEEDFAWIEQNAEGFDVSVRNITSEHTTLALQGPKSHDVMRKLTDFDLETLRYYRFVEARVAGVDCLLARMGYTGEFGYELHFHPKDGAQVWTETMAAGADSGIVPLGQTALESLRQEAGYLLVGNDHDKTTNPLEAGIGFTVKLDKPQFNGKAALTELARGGVRRSMAWLNVPSGAVATNGDPVFSANKQVGQVTSASYSPGRERGTAMAYIDAGHAIPGLNYAIETRGGDQHEAKLSLTPLYKHRDSATQVAAQY